MSSPIRVSVIIPFYRNKGWLKDALESVAGQTYSAYEVIIINDGSEEDISDLEVIYENFIFYSINNSGAAEARNLGINVASGDYICFLDSDDVWRSNKIELQLNYMLDNSLDWCHTSYIKFWDDDPVKKVNVNTKLEGNILPRMFITCPIATPCVMLKTNILKEDNTVRFNKDFRVGEDSYLWFRIGEKYKLGHLNEYLTLVRIRGQNAALNPLFQLESKSQIFLIIKNRKDLFKNIIQYKSTLFGFYLCFLLHRFISNSSKRFPILKSRGLVSILYAFPYLYLKTTLKIFNL